MEFTTIQMSWKAEEDGTIEGYGAIFGNVDLGGDIVQAGAFKKSLRSNRTVKMLRNHDADCPIGLWTELKEDQTGLRVKGRMVLSVDDAKETYDLVRAGAMDGLSIGYNAVKATRDKASGARIIQEADLWEVSIVTFPMNELAVIDAVKAREMGREELERRLTHDAGMSRSVARRLLAGGYDAVKAMRGAGEADELADALRARIHLMNP